LQPFCSVVISKNANGPLTSASLNSLSKFALYGFFSSDFPGAKDGINMVAHAIAGCIFEESDRESDEIILMKLLELATMTFRSDASDLLTVGAAWDMYATCLSIFGQIRSSKVLRSEAESTLRHLTLTMFCRIHSVLQRSSAAGIGGRDTSPSTLANEVKKSYWDTDKDTYSVSQPVGMVMFLVKTLTALTGYLDSKAQPVEYVQLALSLVNVALEAGGTHLGQLQPIVEILRGDICRHLLVATQSDDLVVFNLSLRVVFNLFVSIKDHMKVQLEVFLNSVHIRLLQQSKVQQHQSFAKNAPSSSLPGLGGTSASDKVLNLWNAREEMILESLLEFANEPLVLQDLYVNYDCDVKCTNLYDTIISVLCTKSLPHKLQQLQLLDKIIDEDEYLDDLTTAGTKPKPKPRAKGASSSSSGAPSASFPKVLQLINANKSITDEAAYSDNNNVWYHPLDGINKLAIDGLLTILRSLARKCRLNDADSRGQAANGSGSGSKTGLSAPGSREHSPFVSTVNLERASSTSSLSGRSSTDILPMPMHVQFKSPMPSRQPPTSTSDAVDLWCMNSVDDEDDSLSGDTASESTSASAGTGSKSGGAPLNYLSGNTFTPYSGGLPRPADNADLLDGAEDAQFLLNARAKTAELLKQRKLKKQRLALIVEQFNTNPFSKDWVKLSISTNILPSAPIGLADSLSPVASSSSTAADPKALALFLKQNPGLDKTRIGEFLSKGPAEKYPYFAEVLKEYVNTFDFVGASFDHALRTFLGYFRLPGEAQCIDRLMEAFAQKLFRDLGQNNPFATGDAAFILSFSTIMLNTDLHNPNLPDAKRMTKDQFINNNRNINDGESLPREYLENLYDCIKETQIKLDVDIAEVSGALDMNSWNNLITKNAALQAPPVFTPAVTARRSESSHPVHAGGLETDDTMWSLLNIYQKDMFLVLAKPVLNCLLVVLERCYLDDVYIVRIIEGLLDFSTLCESLKLESLLDRLLIALYSSIKRIMEHRALKETRDKAQYGVANFAVDDLLSEKEFSTLKSLLEHDIPQIVDVSNDTRSSSVMQTLAASHLKKVSPKKAATPGSSIASKQSAENLTSVGSSAGSAAKGSSEMLSRNDEEISLEQMQIQQMLLKSNKDKLRYIGSVQIRSEMILKLLLHCGQKHAGSITHNGWQVVFAALLWLRGKGLLGESARLSQVYQLGYAFNDSANKSSRRGGCGPREQSMDDYHNYYYSNSTNCSVYEQACHKAAMGLKMSNILGDFQNDENASTVSSIGRDSSGGSGVLGNIWSIFSGQEATSGAPDEAGELSFSDELDMDRYISHYTWNSSALYCARNVASLRSANQPRLWDSHCFMKHAVQYHDIIELSYEHSEESSSAGGSDAGMMGLASASSSSLTKLSNPQAGSTNSNTNSSGIVLLKTKDIGISNSLFVCLMYLIRSFVVELTEFQYNVGNEGVSQGLEQRIDRGLGGDSDLGEEAVTEPRSEAGRRKPTKQAVCSKQLDVCFLLDLGFRVMTSNVYGYSGRTQFDPDSGARSPELRILTSMYRRLVGLFDLILDEHLDVFCTHYPYVVERVSLLLLDLTVVVATSLPAAMGAQTEDTSDGLDSAGVSATTTPSKTPAAMPPTSPLSPPPTPRSARTGNKLPDSYTIADILWYSLEVLRNVSPSVLAHTGHLVGKGISSFVLTCCSTGAVENFSLQNWCILFHIFSATATSCPGIGRQYVWDALCHLVDNHHVNTMNFSPSRHLLLKYLHNVFPQGGDSAEELARAALSRSVAPEGEGAGADNVHLVQAMVRVTKLAMMALAGCNMGVGEDREALVTYPCPVLSMAYQSGTLGMAEGGAQGSRAATEYDNYYKFVALFVGNEEHYPDIDIGASAAGAAFAPITQPFVQIRPLRFVRTEEVEVLWAETTKLLAEVVLLLRADTSEQAIYSLQALFIAGRGVAPLTWAAVLGEMTTRLPLNLNSFGVQAPSAATDSLQSLADYKANDALRGQMVSVALHGCSVIFEAMVEHFERLLSRHADLFVPIWAKFVSLLVTNSAALHLMQDAQHASSIAELFEMTGNLLRLFSKAVKSAKQLNSTSKSEVDHLSRVLTHTWNSCVTLHPALVGGLQDTYPSLVKELLPLCPAELLEQVTRAQVPPPPPPPPSFRVAAGPEPAPARAPVTDDSAAPQPVAQLAPDIVVPLVHSVAPVPAPALVAALAVTATPPRPVVSGDDNATPPSSVAGNPTTPTITPATAPAQPSTPSAAPASSEIRDLQFASPLFTTPSKPPVSGVSTVCTPVSSTVAPVEVANSPPAASLSSAAASSAASVSEPATYPALTAVTTPTAGTAPEAVSVAAVAPVEPGTSGTPRSNRMTTYDNKKFMNFRKSFVV